MKQWIRATVALITTWTVCLLGGSTVLSFSPTHEHLLAETPDAGIDYQNALIFFGESTTSHLASRGVLTGGKQTTQVWTTDTGTALLSPKITSLLLRDPSSGTERTLTEMVQVHRPAYLVLSFGLNGIVGFDKSPSLYLQSYQKLIDAVQFNSPTTAIILQTVYPVTAPTDGSKWNFSVSPAEVNAMIDRLNAQLLQIADANTGVKIANTASVLRTSDGSLDPALSAGDGIHLNAQAYERVLSYLRTHAYHTPLPLPITPDQWRSKA